MGHCFYTRLGSVLRGKCCSFWSLLVVHQGLEVSLQFLLDLSGLFRLQVPLGCLSGHRLLLRTAAQSLLQLRTAVLVLLLGRSLLLLPVAMGIYLLGWLLTQAFPMCPFWTASAAGLLRLVRLLVLQLRRGLPR